MKHIEYINELKEIVEFTTTLYNEVHLKSKDAPYATMMELFATIIEYANSYIILIENNFHIGTQAVARAVLEAYVDMRNIQQNGNYANYLYSEYYDREKELATSKSKIRLNRNKRNELYKLYDQEGTFKVLSISEKFKLANLKTEYTSVYSVLSANTHSGVFSLINRLLEHGKDKMPSYRTLFKTTPSSIETSTIPLISYYLFDACKMVGKGHGDDVLILVAKFGDLLKEKYS